VDPEPLGFDDQGWTARVEVPHGHPAFEGHFPGRPILPAIVQLDLVARIAEAAGLAPLAAVPNLRLRHAVGPGATLEIRLERPDPSGCARFSIRHGETLVTTGSLVVASRGAVR
jgi:3-hydroxyacyl-[acyl-carrier-protein] dehydratase